MPSPLTVCMGIDQTRSINFGLESIVTVPCSEIGELGAIVGWIQAQAVGTTRKRETPAAFATGVSVSVVAGIGFEPMTFRL